ncbi:uncharacterized protein MICPUCDRAFT_57086 [Micromonas pusilla CCMP1545]|uniref:Predicted protein n=1 Tax=Micromonas pusilla (strain CCMP1545) TaxID=564608 RepID=C1MPY2_MICPC|nr:uncharacterized protein MICPUCDRAFT_57086 [Micromonas pusilla CCMP1545]EEH57617.1 predicted protein [Micromonas pusilla CCMP1545]|eukprot:XP_003057666.1 predicted protein [Micromonas pusilla CCMP1545]
MDIQSMMDEASERERMIYAKFRLYDVDGTGTIDVHEIQELLKELRVVGVANDADRYLVKKLMHELGRDEDGVIDFEEFKVRRAHSLSPRRQLDQLGRRIQK